MLPEAIFLIYLTKGEDMFQSQCIESGSLDEVILNLLLQDLSDDEKRRGVFPSKRTTVFPESSTYEEDSKKKTSREPSRKI